MRLGANDPCWCGSGVKYKRCHRSADKASSSEQALLTSAPMLKETAAATFSFDARDYSRGVKRTAKDFRRVLRKTLDPASFRGMTDAFDMMFQSDISAVLSHLAHGYEAVNAIGLHRMSPKPAHLEQAYFLLHESLNLVVVALRNLRSGSVLASDGVLRQALELVAVGYALARDASGELLKKFVGGKWRHPDLTQSINTAKALYPSVGPLYGVLTNSAAHPSLAHIHHSISTTGGEGEHGRIRITAWFDPRDGSRFKLGMIRLERVAISVWALIEAALIELATPSLWAIDPEGLRWVPKPVVEQRLLLADEEQRRIENPFLVVYSWVDAKDRDEVQWLLGTSEGDALRDIEKLRAAVESHPASFVAHYLLAAAYEETGDTKAAIREFEIAWRLRSDGYDVWSRLERLYAFSGDGASLESFYRHSVERDPEDYVAFHNLGMFCFRLRRFEEAFECFRRAHGIKPERYGAVYNAADVLMKMERYKDAIDFYHHAAEQDPEHPGPWHGVGVAYVRLEQYQQAYAAFRKAVMLDSGYFASWVNLASVCQKLGRPRRALICALRAQALAPGDKRVETLLGQLRSRCQSTSRK